MMTVPVVSNPLLPALPAICVYSPGKRFRKDVPSCFRMPEKTTHFAGILTPIANVSVANSTLTTPRENRISTTSKIDVSFVRFDKVS